MDYNKFYADFYADKIASMQARNYHSQLYNDQVNIYRDKAKKEANDKADARRWEIIQEKETANPGYYRPEDFARMKSEPGYSAAPAAYKDANEQKLANNSSFHELKAKNDAANNATYQMSLGNQNNQKTKPDYVSPNGVNHSQIYRDQAAKSNAATYANDARQQAKVNAYESTPTAMNFMKQSNNTPQPSAASQQGPIQFPGRQKVGGLGNVIPVKNV